MNTSVAVLLAAALVVAASPASGQAVDGAAVYERACASCHASPTPESRAPQRDRLGPGGTLGGQWGGAVDGTQAYFGVNGTSGPSPGGMRAVKLATGEEVWSRPASDRLCGSERGCSPAQGGAVTAIAGMVFSGSMDGGLRAYASDDGSLVWQFDTNRSFQTVNGVPASGGAMDGPGAAVANGMLFVNSGYVSLIGRPGNVLLAFGVE